MRLSGRGGKRKREVEELRQERETGAGEVQEKGKAETMRVTDLLDATP